MSNTVSKHIEQISTIVANRFEEVNVRYIELMAKHISDIGALTATDIHRLDEMARMQANIDEINNMLARATDKSVLEIQMIFKKSGMLEYSDMAKYYLAKNIVQPTFFENTVINNYMKSMAIATGNTFRNISHTTAISQDYRNAVDSMIQEVTMGMTDYESVTRRIINKTVSNGLRVVYASGLTRRLDSALKLNLIEGIRRLNSGIREEAGKQFGADGVQIDAHGLCAEDHLPYQGRQYSLKKFNKIQSELKRPIGTMNCQHNISYIVLGISPNPYSAQELQQMKDYSQEMIEVNGKKYTRYECTQVMRRLETRMRYEKEKIIGLKSANQDIGKEKERLNILESSYRRIANKSGVKPRFDNAYVPNYKGRQIKPKQVKI